jgi:hypothetical protein
VDYSTIGLAVDWADVFTVMATVAVAIVGLLVAMKGAKTLFRLIKGA